MLVEEEIFVHAQRALFLLEHYYRKPFTCRYQPSLQLFLIVNVCDIIARFFPAKAASADLDGPEALLLGLRVLEESYANGRGSPVASVLQEQLRLAAAQYSPIVKVPPGQEHDLNSKTSNHPDCTYEMVMDACTRAVYFQPLWGVREKFDKKMAQDWCDAGPSYGFQRPRGDTNNLRSFRSLPHEPDRSANYLMQIQNLLNSN